MNQILQVFLDLQLFLVEEVFEVQNLFFEPVQKGRVVLLPAVHFLLQNHNDHFEAFLHFCPYRIASDGDATVLILPQFHETLVEQVVERLVKRFQTVHNHQTSFFHANRYVVQHF
jgi:hypothetical protein